jgi:hypothetical protein
MWDWTQLPIEKEEIMLKAKALAALDGCQFNGPNGCPSNHWWSDFTKRWNVRSTKSRCHKPDAPTIEEVTLWFDHYMHVVDHYKFDASTIYNFDETGTYIRCLLCDIDIIERDHLYVVPVY